MQKMLRSPLQFVFIGLLIFSVMQSCGEQSDSESIVSQIRQDRQEKNQYFQADSSSPLLPEQRQDFTGLRYYPVDLDYRVETQIREYPSKDTVEMTTTKDRKQSYLRWGWFDFTIHGKTDTLNVYKPVEMPNDYPPYFFIPFYDRTNNKTTYGGGRYLDTKIHDSNDYVIDFNRAYNPYCAYDHERWSCPIPPMENRVNFAVEAGEKMLPLDQSK